MYVYVIISLKNNMSSPAQNSTQAWASYHSDSSCSQK